MKNIRRFLAPESWSQNSEQYVYTIADIKRLISGSDWWDNSDNPLEDAINECEEII